MMPGDLEEVVFRFYPDGAETLACHKMLSKRATRRASRGSHLAFDVIFHTNVDAKIARLWTLGGGSLLQL
jgi:hypothetical protein